MVTILQTSAACEGQWPISEGTTNTSMHDTLGQVCPTFFKNKPQFWEPGNHSPTPNNFPEENLTLIRVHQPFVCGDNERVDILTTLETANFGPKRLGTPAIGFGKQLSQLLV